MSKSKPQSPPQSPSIKTLLEAVRDAQPVPKQWQPGYYEKDTLSAQKKLAAREALLKKVRESDEMQRPGAI